MERSAWLDKARRVDCPANPAAHSQDVTLDA
jgi:hypothetical protein